MGSWDPNIRRKHVEISVEIHSENGSHFWKLENCALLPESLSWGFVLELDQSVLHCSSRLLGSAVFQPWFCHAPIVNVTFVATHRTW